MRMWEDEVRALFQNIFPSPMTSDWNGVPAALVERWRFLFQLRLATRGMMWSSRIGSGILDHYPGWTPAKYINLLPSFAPAHVTCGIAYFRIDVTCYAQLWRLPRVLTGHQHLTASFLRAIAVHILHMPLRIPTSVPGSSKFIDVVCFEGPQVAQ